MVSVRALRPLQPQRVRPATAVVGDFPIVVARGPRIGDLLGRRSSGGSGDERPTKAVPLVQVEIEVGTRRTAQPGVVRARDSAVVIGAVRLILVGAGSGKAPGVRGA